MVLGCNELSQAEIEQRITNSAGLTGLDRLCQELPKPEGFQFVRKGLSGNAQSSIIDYRYKSDKGFKEVKDFYFDWFKNNGWSLDARMSLERYFEFRKENLSVSVENGAFFDANYSISCVSNR